MNKETAIILNQLTTGFYARSAESFSETRGNAWPGWERCISHIKELDANGHELQILDIGCGNLRFEDYLDEQLESPHEVWAIDNCLELVGDNSRVLFQEIDVISALIDGKDITNLMEAPQCDAVCAFGFMHHVPGAKARRALLAAMLESSAPGGLVMIALWQFANNERMLRKAEKTTNEALARFPQLDLEEGDYLLGWKEDGEVFRYCHSFTEGEAGGLIGFAKLRGGHLVDSFNADGKTNDMNRYLIFKKS